jgi:hypothetical protein
MRFPLLLLAAFSLPLSACLTTRSAPAPKVVTMEDLDARAEDGHFTFYSLRENRTVPPADSASTDWDLAFNSTTILVNGGASGPGMGGAVVLQDTAFAAVTEAPPADSFAVDRGTERTETAIPGGAGNGWYDYDFATGIVEPRPAVLVIRTADGRYAKVDIESYYRGAPPAEELDPEEGFRYYTFRYLFQPDGSRQLQ